MHHDHIRHYRPNHYRHSSNNQSQNDMRTRRHPEGKTSIQAVLKEAGLALLSAGWFLAFVLLVDDFFEVLK